MIFLNALSLFAFLVSMVAATKVDSPIAMTVLVLGATVNAMFFLANLPLMFNS
jgi:hypothetical protein